MKSPLTCPATRRSAGFTLVELMITLAIVAILVAIAYPSYSNYIMKSHRADAKTALLDLASRQERYFALQNNYASTPSALGYAGTAFPIAVQTSGQSYYQLYVQVTGSPGTSTLPGFRRRPCRPVPVHSSRTPAAPTRSISWVCRATAGTPHRSAGKKERPGRAFFMCARHGRSMCRCLVLATRRAADARRTGEACQAGRAVPAIRSRCRPAQRR